MNNKFYTEFGMSEVSVPFARISGVEYFNTEAVFDCGQAFRWKKDENGELVQIEAGEDDGTEARE